MKLIWTGQTRPADPAARGSQTHRIVIFPVGSLELYSVLLTEGNILDTC